MTTPAITTAKEVIKFLKDNNFDIDEINIKEKFSLIGNPAQRVNTPDKQWVACKQPYEVKTVVREINDIINPDDNPTIKEAVEEAVKKTCEAFEDIPKKPRIPFYVFALNNL